VKAHDHASSIDASTLRAATRRLIPFLFLLYVAAYLDRINVGFAQLQMKDALGFGDAVYGLGAGIFFIGYFVFEVPSNLILARVGARVWIARIMITWGLISSAMAFVGGPYGFYALRFLLGVAEAGFFPGIIYYLGLWFPAEDRAAAVSRFMTATAIAGVVGGPLSAALFTLDGAFGLAGWQWIFLAEGAPSIALGIATLFYLTDRPADATWLSSEARTALTARIDAQAAEIARQHPTTLARALLHPLVWRLSLLYFTLLLAFYTVSFWTPQIVRSLTSLGLVGISLVSAIPFVAAAISMVLASAHSDRTSERCWHVAIAALVGALGLFATAWTHSLVPGIAALSIAAIGIWSALPVFWSLPTAFVSGTAAAAAIALINSFGNLGGFVGPYVIGRMREASGGYATSLVVMSGALLVTAVLALSLRRTAADSRVDRR